jgi:hypothetical protein
VLFIGPPNQNYGQSVKRQAISSYGATVSIDNVIWGQTAGQCYNTEGDFENGTLVLQGFQQPSSYTIEDLSSFEWEDLDISVFPNPATYSLSVTSPEPIEQAYIRVIDMTGKQVFYEKVSNLLLYTLYCNSWVKGVYLISVSDSEQNSKTVQLIITK